MSFERGNNPCKFFVDRLAMEYCDKPGCHNIACGVCGNRIQIVRRNCTGPGRWSAGVDEVNSDTMEISHD